MTKVLKSILPLVAVGVMMTSCTTVPVDEVIIVPSSNVKICIDTDKNGRIYNFLTCEKDARQVQEKSVKWSIYGLSKNDSVEFFGSFSSDKVMNSVVKQLPHGLYFVRLIVISADNEVGADNKLVIVLTDGAGIFEFSDIITFINRILPRCCFS